MTATIDKYVHISLARPLIDGYHLRYSETERVASPGEVRHTILRKCLADVPAGLELTVMSDVPAGTGLGSSGAFTVGVLKALHPDWSKPRLADAACEIDTGQQDQWSAVYGGCNVFDFRAQTIRPIDTYIDRYLALYYTGTRREAGQEPAGRHDRRDVQAEIQALEHSDPDRMGWCFQRQWAEKYERFPSEFHESCGFLIRQGMKAGAFGGKLIGAGGGGFLLFAATEFDRLDDAMKRHGLRRLPFRFDHVGVT